jgi:hypothetical protein
MALHSIVKSALDSFPLYLHNSTPSSHGLALTLRPGLQPTLAAMTAVAAPPPIPLGSAVPSLTAHAISVSLPTWDDNVGYEEGDKRVVDRMETGYPRFFIHRSIQKVSRVRIPGWSRRYHEPFVYPGSAGLLSLTWRTSSPACVSRS